MGIKCQGCDGEFGLAPHCQNCGTENDFGALIESLRTENAKLREELDQVTLEYRLLKSLVDGEADLRTD